MNRQTAHDINVETEVPKSGFGYALLILQASRLIALCALSVGAVGLLIALFSDPVAESRFLPEVAESRYGQIAGMAAQFGIEIAAPPEAESPELWVELLQGRELLTSIVLDTISVDESEELLTISELYGVKVESDSTNLHDALDAMRDHMSVRRSSQTGLITLRVRGPSPEAAEEINRRLLDAVNTFNVTSRTHRARIEREFIEERLAEAEDSLRQAENEIEKFLEANRTYETSASLRLQASRLERAVQRRQEVVTLLVQVAERARIEEVRTIPLISIIDRPEGSARQTGRPALSFAVGAALGSLFAVLWVLVATTFRAAARNNEAEARHLSAAVAELTTSFRGSRG